MAGPAFDSTKHDIGLNGVGYVVVPGTRVQRSDALPATKRAALGESQFDIYPLDAFMAQTTFEGGVGQGRLVAQDSFLSGFCDGTHQGHLFPQRAATAESAGGTTTWYFTRRPLGAAPVLYGMTATAITLVGTATTRARTAGAIGCKPVVTGSQFVYWTQGSAGARTLYYWDGNTATAPTDITSRLTGCDSADVVARYERGLYVLGLGAPTTTPAIVQQALGTDTAATSVTATFSSSTTSGNTILVYVTMGDAGTPTATAPSGYSTAQATTSANPRVAVFYRTNAPTTSSVTVTFSEACDVAYVDILEVEGLDPDDPLIGVQYTRRSASSNAGTPSITSGAAAIGISLHATTVSATFGTYSSGWTELDDDANASGSRSMASRVVSSSTAMSTTATASSAAGDTMGVITVWRALSLTSGSKMFGLWRSTDEGTSFDSIFSTISTGIGEARAALAVGGYLYFTTDTGLFRLKLTEQQYADQVITELVALQGELDRWDTPFSNDTVAPTGKWMDTWEGLLYYNVGSTVRQFAPSDTGGQGRQLWPPQGWDWLVGEVRALVCSEGGVYFTFQVGGNAVLMRYNGRSFQSLAKFVTGSEGDYLHFHNGRLYVKADPAKYLNFKYPSSRPDAAGLTAADFTTGYWVSSRINLDAEMDYKVVRKFALMAEWSATANAGTITLEYRSADSGLHPDVYFPDNAGITWTSVGTMTVADGNTKEFSLSTPIQAKAIYLRVTLAPGASGYPILEGVIVNGRPVLRPIKRFTADLVIGTGTQDRTGGTLMYAGASGVNSAIDELMTLRGDKDGPTTRYFTLDYVDDDNSVTQYTVTFESMSDQLMQHGHDGSSNPQLEARFGVTLVELP